MEVAPHSREQVGVLPNALHPRALVEARRADRLPHEVPIPFTSDFHTNPSRFHDIDELRSYFTRFAHRFNVHKMTLAPRCAVRVPLPLKVRVEEREVIALWDEELFTRRIALLCAVLGSIKDLRD